MDQTVGSVTGRTRLESAPLVSIVTPFYNTQDYLSECIDSVLRQTYEHWEYILVDNCSTDGSTEIAKRYADRFPDKIRLLRTESFLSQVQNYNFALTCISPDSQYCKMVQADDWLFPDCIRSMVELAEVHPSVGIVSAYQLDGVEVRPEGLPYPSSMVRGRHVGRLCFLGGAYTFGTPTSVLMRSQIIRSRVPFYDERHAPFEDGHACFDILKVWDFGFVHQVLIYSRRQNGSLSSGLSSFGAEFFVHLSWLVAHGKDYLSEEEFHRCLKRAEREYFVHLTKSACALRPQTREFWEFHRKGLASINYSFNWKRLGKSLPRAVVEKAWDAFWRRWDKDSRFTADDPWA